MKNIIPGSEQKDRKKRTKLTLEQVNFILSSYRVAGVKPIHQIAKDIGVYPQVVKNCLKRNGVAIDSTLFGNRFSGKASAKWRGGRRIQKGYIQVMAPNHPNSRPSDGYIYEHRLVMSEKLGRPLKEEEVVHHINGDTMDNRPENLELIKNNGKHISEHVSGWKRNSFGRFSEEEEVPKSCIILEWGGERGHVAWWARKIGVSKGCMKWRLDHGKKGEELFAPNSRKV